MTKNEERATLQQIAALIQSAGADSYIAAAFAGCVEMASNNIENDWMLSYKESAEELQNQFDHLRSEADAMAARIEVLEAQTISEADARTCFRLAKSAASDQMKRANAAAAEIVKLAENPRGVDFESAVKTHRTASDLAQQFEALADRVTVLF